MTHPSAFQPLIPEESARASLVERASSLVASTRFVSCAGQTEHFSEHLKDLLRHLSANPWPVGSEQSVIKPEVHTALHYVALTGPLERSRFLSTSGMPERTARRVLASLLHFGVLKSDSRLGPVYFQIPFDALRWLFPRLWPEAESH